MPTLMKPRANYFGTIEDYGTTLPGFSPFIRWMEPMFKPGDYLPSRRGGGWVFGRATAAIAAPTATRAQFTVTANAQKVIAGAVTIGTAGAGYRFGDTIPVRDSVGTNGGYGAVILVKATNAAGGVTAAEVASGGGGYVVGARTLNPTLDPQMAWSLCAVTTPAGTVGAGATHRSFSPTDIGEYGWFEVV